MRTANANRLLQDSIIESRLNPNAAIHLIETVVGSEKACLEANTHLYNEYDKLKNEYNIDQAEILLSLLRMHSDRLRRGS